jgi:hypothetical protein
MTQGPMTLPPMTLPPMTLPPMTLPPMTLPRMTLPRMTLAPVRLAPHPADERPGVFRAERPPVNAFDQPMWDLFEAVTMSLHGTYTDRSLILGQLGSNGLKRGAVPGRR